MREYSRLAAAVALAAIAAAPASTTLRAADGVTVFATRGEPARPKALILLFHQAGSSKDEYATIAPRLNAAGYATLAIDQRAGGTLFGRNETVGRLGGSKGYLDAERDLEAALAWGRQRRLPIILWGSSYSAALVFRLAARHPSEVKAVLAFSPGEYLGRPDAVRRAAAGVRVPVFVTSAADHGEIVAARAVLAASPSATKVQFTPRVGIHGSATLIPGRNPKGAAENWQAVTNFLQRL